MRGFPRRVEDPDRLPAPLRALLAVAAAFFRVAVALRALAYRLGIARVRQVPARVVSVGNLTAGGTGKTPLVEWLALWIAARGEPVAIVARGYGAARAGEPNDETLLLRANLPLVPQVLDPDRVRGGRAAIERYGARVLVLDDAFQHRRIARDLDIVVVDALDPFGRGRLLPRGFLREPIGALARADAVVITRADLVPEARLAAIRARVRAVRPDLLVAEAVEEPLALVPAGAGQDAGAGGAAGAAPLPVEWLAGRSIFAFCGIGNPAAFYERLGRLGARLLAQGTFRDHHRYAPADLAHIADAARRVGAEAIVCTQKDAVKLSAFPLPAGVPPLYALRIRAAFRAGEGEIGRLLEARVLGAPGTGTYR